MSEAKTGRRDFLKYLAGGIAGLVVGGVGGYLAGSAQAPAPGVRTVTQTVRETITQRETVTKTVTQTVTAAKPARGIPQTPLKIGLMNPISGGGAPVGDPGVKGAQLAAKIINETGGILGRKIELSTPLDTRAKPDIAVDHFKRLAAEGYEYIVGGISSAVGLALAEEADRQGVIWLPCEVWTPKLFEKPRKFSFRLSWVDSAAGVGVAYMALRVKPDVKTVAGINPDYEHGRVQWEAFKLAIKRLKPDVEIVGEIFHPLFQKDMTPYVSELIRLKPDVVQSTSWGSDIINILKQGIPAGLFKMTTFLWSCNLGLEGLGELWPPEGMWIGSQYARTYPPWDLWPPNREFNEAFEREFGAKAFNIGAHSAANNFTNLFAIKQAIERAYEVVGGWPDVDEVAQAMVGMSIIGPKGIISIREDHDFWGPQIWAYAKLDPNKGYPVPDPKTVITFPPELTNPSPGVDWREWINRLRPIV